MSVSKSIQVVTDRIAARCEKSRREYLDRIVEPCHKGVHRAALSCGNRAHSFAACSSSDKERLTGSQSLNLGIVTSYNDMLSAHQPYAAYPDIIKEAARSMGASAQVAGGAPAICDGVTQGQPGMDLSPFSRDVIAMSTAIALSHYMFDAALYLGVCDKIVPRLLTGALPSGICSPFSCRRSLLTRSRLSILVYTKNRCWPTIGRRPRRSVRELAY